MNKEKKNSFINKIYGIKARKILEDIITEEEKSSLKHLEHFMNRIREENSLPDVEIGLDTSIEDILYLIEKLLKEIEELKQITMLYNSYEIPSGSERKIVIADTEYFEKGFFRKNFIAKDTIREKIKKYDKWIEKGEYTESLEAQRYALNELLED